MAETGGFKPLQQRLRGSGWWIPATFAGLQSLGDRQGSQGPWCGAVTSQGDGQRSRGPDVELPRHRVTGRDRGLEDRSVCDALTSINVQAERRGVLCI
ncbi:hypothetical protein RR48_00735 [Papilio machaon]|uniref:Uncharacterized protein n=1 Tax=Papilio machaon TaxID=76193 RepID=A0A0N1IQR5_PAPMA|nr:hypothetical protein RR48_00735 [Papilio machaon]